MPVHPRLKNPTAQSKVEAWNDSLRLQLELFGVCVTKIGVEVQNEFDVPISQQ
jgi:hypothetical protein